MIIDAHHHVWDPAERPYPWMGADVTPLRRRFDLGDYRAATAGTGVTGGVIVQATSSLEETEHLLGLTATSPTVAGVVGWVDLRAPDVAGTLDRLRAGAGGTALVGVRHQVEDEPDPAWLADPATLHGLRAVAAAGLTFDLLVLPQQLDAAVTAARAVPELSMILDHGAKPPIAAGIWEPWSTAVARLASAPNVTCKLSGLVTVAGRGWSTAALAPWADRLLDLFGPGRLLFGSDWPVCTLVATYRQVLDAAHRLLAGLGVDERDQVLAGNARRVYGLGASPASCLTV